MRRGNLRRFKVYVPNEQGSDALMHWQTPSPYAIPPFIGIGVILKLAPESKTWLKTFLRV